MLKQQQQKHKTNKNERLFPRFDIFKYIDLSLFCFKNASNFKLSLLI